MDLKVTTLEGKDAGKVSLSDSVFGLEPRDDILQRMVRWQLARKRQGTHKTKGRSEISRTGAKMFRQKGTGLHVHLSSAVVVRLMDRLCAVMNTTCLKRSELWHCVMRFRPSCAMTA